MSDPILYMAMQFTNFYVIISVLLLKSHLTQEWKNAYDKWLKSYFIAQFFSSLSWYVWFLTDPNWHEIRGAKDVPIITSIWRQVLLKPTGFNFQACLDEWGGITAGFHPNIVVLLEVFGLAHDFYQITDDCDCFYMIVWRLFFASDLLIILSWWKKMRSCSLWGRWALLCTIDGQTDLMLPVTK